MSTKTRSANYHKKNCIIPKGFENYYKKNREFSDDGVEIIKAEIEKTDFQKTFLYKFIERENRVYGNINEIKETNLIASTNLIYFTGYKQEIKNDKIIFLLSKFNSYKSEFFNLTISQDFKNFVNMMAKIQESYNQTIDFVISGNNLKIVCKNDDVGLESEFYLEIQENLNITYTFNLEKISKVINNSLVNDNVEIEITENKWAIFKNLTKDWSAIFTHIKTPIPEYKNEIESKTVEIPKLEINQNQIILREKFELKVLEIPVKSLPKTEVLDFNSFFKLLGIENFRQVNKITDIVKFLLYQNLNLNDLKEILKISKRLDQTIENMLNPIYWENWIKVWKNCSKTKQEIKTEKPKTNTRGFYILVEYFDNDCKKYSLFIDKFFTTRENAKNQIKQSRESKNALAIRLQIVSEKILNEKLKNKKTNQTINYLWQIN